MNSRATTPLSVTGERSARSSGETLDSPQSVAASVETDEALLARIQQDDKQALGELFHRYVRRVRGVALRILRDIAEAEDLAQDLFLFIRRKARVFDSSKSSASSWVIQMTYQRALERRRYLTSRQFYTAQSEGVAEEIVGQNATSEDDHALDTVIARAGLTRAFEKLSENQRVTLQMVFFEGYTLREISDKLGQPLGNVRGHYYRGLDRLRREMFPGGKE